MANSVSSASISRLPSGRSERASVNQNRASLTTWIAVLAAMIGSFMAIRLSQSGVFVSPLHAGKRGPVRGFLGCLRLHP